MSAGRREALTNACAPTGSAEGREQRAQEAGELGALLVGQVGEEVGLGGQQRLEGAVDGGLALGGQPDEHAATVLGVRQPLDETARSLGLRLVTYSRPGYGASTPRPEAGCYADDVEDSVLVLDHLAQQFEPGVADFLIAPQNSPSLLRQSRLRSSGNTASLSDGAVKPALSRYV